MFELTKGLIRKEIEAIEEKQQHVTSNTEFMALETEKANLWKEVDALNASIALEEEVDAMYKSISERRAQLEKYAGEYAAASSFQEAANNQLKAAQFQLVEGKLFELVNRKQFVELVRG